MNKTTYTTATQAAIHPTIRRTWNTLRDDAVGATSKTNVEINKDKMFSACGWVQIYGLPLNRRVLAIVSYLSWTWRLPQQQSLWSQDCNTRLGVAKCWRWGPTGQCGTHILDGRWSPYSCPCQSKQFWNCSRRMHTMARPSLRRWGHSFAFFFSQRTWSHLCHVLSSSSSSSL